MRQLNSAWCPRSNMNVKKTSACRLFSSHTPHHSSLPATGGYTTSNHIQPSNIVISLYWILRRQLENTHPLPSVVPVSPRILVQRDHNWPIRCLNEYTTILTARISSLMCQSWIFVLLCLVHKSLHDGSRLLANFPRFGALRISGRNSNTCRRCKSGKQVHQS